MGSLACALASFLDAKSHRGTWLVRIENIDPPREIDGAIDDILNALKHHELHWDAPLRYQSEHSQQYQDTLKWLDDNGLSYRCGCTRKRLATLDQHYDNHCRTHPPALTDPASIRLNLTEAANRFKLDTHIRFVDALQGSVEEKLDDHGDFQIHRKDGLFAYQLAVVVDDIQQNVSHVIRGIDLMDCCAKQTFFTQLLGAKPPTYGHIPVLIKRDGSKLSKQTQAKPIANTHAASNLHQCLRQLGQQPPESLKQSTPKAILDWAIAHWNPSALSGIQQITCEQY